MFGFYLKILTIDEPKTSINSQPRLPFLKPKSSTGSAFCPVMSKLSTTESSQFPTVGNQNVYHSTSQSKQMLSNSLVTQTFMESSKNEQTYSQFPKHDDLQNISTEVPDEIRTLLPPNNNVRSISPSHFVVFPPEIPLEYRIYCQSKSFSPQSEHKITDETQLESFDVSESKDDQKFIENENTNTATSDITQAHETFDETKSDNMISSNANQVETIISQSTIKCLEIIEPNYDRELYKPENSISNTSNFTQFQQPISDTAKIEPYIKFELQEDSITDNDNITESPLVATLKTAPERSYSPLPTYVDDTEFLPKPIKRGIQPMTMASVLAIAPERSYSPLPTFVEASELFPKQIKPPLEPIRLADALAVAPERSYSPLPTFVDASELIPKQTEPPIESMTMAEALAIASDRSYKLPESNIKRPVGNNPVRYMHGYNKKTPVEPLLMKRSLIYTPISAVDSEEEQIAILGLKSFPPVSDELKLSTAAGDFDRTEPNFENVEELVFDKPEVEEPLNEDEDAVEPVVESIPRHPFTASGLHEPSHIPRYQRNIPENPHRANPNDKSSGKPIDPKTHEKTSTFTPKASITNPSFLKQESNIHSKIAPVLGYEPSSLDGRSSTF